MDDDFLRDSGPRGGDNLFLWTVLILLLIGFAMACWMGTFYIFGHPEYPASYKILKKLKKVEAPKRFDVEKAPQGEFRTAKQLYDKYITYTRLQLEQENSNLIRNYINNYQATKMLVPYMTGRFTILDSYEMKKTDMFESGVIALCQASDFPQVLIEYAYTSPVETVPMLDQMLQTGLDIKLERTLDLSAVIHITKIYDGRLQFTVVPLLYGTYALKQSSGSFSLEPPTDLNMDGGVPVIKAAMLQEAFKAFAEFRKTKEATHPPTRITSAASVTPTPATTELVRVETPTPSPTPAMATSAAPTPEAQPTAAIVQSTPVPHHVPAPSATPAIVVMNSTPRPAATPARVIAPAATPPALSPDGVPLKPFIIAAQTPTTVPTGGGTWRTFPPGQMPRGRVVDPQEVSDLASQGIGGERIYLRGDFDVTASGDSRAVLRAHKGAALLPFAHSSTTSPRIIVEFPAGTTPPSEGSNLTRDESRPFQITDVRRGADGQINVYVREITTQ